MRIFFHTHLCRELYGNKYEYKEDLMSSKALSFTEKKVSRNAVITFVMGIGELLGFAILFLLSILSGGKLDIRAGLAGCLLVLLAFFGVLWGVFSYDDIRTNQRFKISGIVLNVVVIFLGIILIMS